MWQFVRRFYVLGEEGMRLRSLDEVPVVAEQQDVAPMLVVIGIVGLDDRLVASLRADLGPLLDVTDFAIVE